MYCAVIGWEAQAGGFRSHGRWRGVSGTAASHWGIKATVCNIYRDLPTEIKYIIHKYVIYYHPFSGRTTGWRSWSTTIISITSQLLVFKQTNVSTASSVFIQVNSDEDRISCQMFVCSLKAAGCDCTPTFLLPFSTQSKMSCFIFIFWFHIVMCSCPL